MLKISVGDHETAYALALRDENRFAAASFSIIRRMARES